MAWNSKLKFARQRLSGDTDLALSQYLIAMGSNQRHAKFGRPKEILREAKQVLVKYGLQVLASSKIISSRPVGPSQRQYANAMVLVESDLLPKQMLAALQQIEHIFGQRRGQRWSRRVLDLDIILWSGGCFVSNAPALAIPHPAMRQREFVLRPAAEIASDWRDPVTGLTISHLLSRKNHAKPLDRKANPH